MRTSKIPRILLSGLVLCLALFEVFLYEGGQSSRLQAQGSWSPLTPLAHGGLGPILADGNTVHFIYRRDSDSNVYYRRSTDRGQSWSSEVKLFTSGDSWIVLAQSGATVHVVYQADINNTDTTRDIFYQRSKDGGTTWEEARKITFGLNPFRTAIATTGSVVHIAFMDRTWTGEGGNTGNLWYLRSTNGGDTWQPAIKLVNQGASRPTLAAFGEYVHLAWSDSRDAGPTAQEVYYKRSMNRGATWEADRRMTSNPSWSGRTIMTSNETGLVFLIYEEWGSPVPNGDLLVKRSTDHGKTWDGPRLIAPGPATHSDAAAVRSNVHVVWSKISGNVWKAHYSGSSDGGVSWRSGVELDPNNPALGVAAGPSYVIATIDSTYYRRSLLQGAPSLAPPPSPPPPHTRP